MKRGLIAWGPAVMWAAVLFFLSELREIPEEWQRFARVNDKLAHFILYSTLGMTLAWGRRVARSELPHFVPLFIGYAYGALDEWHQSFVPNRTPEFNDWLADVAGVTVGYIVFLLLWRAFFRGSPRQEDGPEEGAGSTRAPVEPPVDIPGIGRGHEAGRVAGYEPRRGVGSAGGRRGNGA